MAQESTLQAQAIKLLRPYCKRLIRINGGVFRGAGGSRVKTYHLYGNEAVAELKNEVIPDLLGFLHNGKPIAIEIKSPSRGSNAIKKERENKQRKFIDTVKSIGGIGTVVESMGDVMLLIAAIEKESRRSNPADRFDAPLQLLGESFHDS